MSVDSCPAALVAFSTSWRTGPHRCVCPGPDAGVVIRRNGQAPYVLAGICVALVAAVPAFADPSLGGKRAQAQQVLAELQGLNASLERSVQQYDLAQVKYERVQHDLRENRHELHIAQRNLVI